ncbi:MAG: hypothetical protein ACXWUG_21230 [Polyangiales bacterium]
MRLASAALAVLLALSTREADAQCVQDQPVTPTCRLHVFNGPVLASTRILSLGGAYQGIAEGLAGFPANAAAPAVRDAHSWDWFDYDLDFSISLPNLFRKADNVEYGGIPINFNYTGWVFITAGGNVQFGPWGVGVVTELERFDLSSDTSGSTAGGLFRGTLSKTTVLLGRTLFDGDLVIGGGIRQIGFTLSGINSAGDRETLVSVAGLAPQIGFLVRPQGQPFRIGATYRMAVSTGQPGPDDRSQVDRWAIPQSVNLPWEIDFGVAFQGGQRPLNVHWTDTEEEEDAFRADIARARQKREDERKTILDATPPEHVAERAKQLAAEEEKLRAQEDKAIAEFDHRLEKDRKKRFKELPREYLLLSLGMLVQGTTENGISLESFFSQRVARAGAVVTYSPRAGVETELVPNLFRPRLGTYVEPSRFVDRPDWKAFRQHVTAGFDLYLFRWGGLWGLIDKETKWRVTTAVDVTNGYWNYGLSIGVWR